MHKYAKAVIPQGLEPWPFDNSDSEYRIVRGNPQASGRLDYGANDAESRMGIWACTEGAFECIESGDELQTLLSGHLILTRDDGESIECRAGDSIYTQKGERVTWDIREAVVKVFFTHLK